MEKILRRTNWFIALVAIVLVSFALRVFRLDAQSLWYDEAFSVYLAHFDLAEITTRTAADIQPPLYYYLLNLWIVLAGDSEFAVRFVSLVFGVLTVPLMFVTARRLFNRIAALIGAFIAMLSPLYLWYSQEARMYTLITFLLLLSSYAMLRALSPSPSKGDYSPRSGAKWGGWAEGKWWALFALANIFAMYTHYFAFVVIAFQFLFSAYCLLHSAYRSNFKYYASQIGLAFLAIIFAFLPWLPNVNARFGQDASYWRGELKLDEAVRHIFINFTVGESVLEAQGQWIAVGWLICLVVGSVSWIVASRKSQAASRQSPEKISQSPNHPIIFLILYLVIPLGLLLFLFSRNPKFNARYLMIASPAFFLLLSAGLASFLSFARSSNVFARFASFAFIALTSAFILLTSAFAIRNAYFDTAFTKADFRGVANYIQQNIAPNEAIILTSGHLFPAFNYYYKGDARQIRLPDDATLNADHVLGYDAATVLNQTAAGARGAWVVLWQDEVVDPNGIVPLLLSSRGKEQKIESSFWQVKLRHWTLQPNAKFSTQPEPGFKSEANFKNEIKLLGYDVPTPTPADVGASFNLYFQALGSLDDDYLVSLRVRDAQGNLWGKLDRRPAGYNYPSMRWKKGENLFGAYTVGLTPATPAGDYFIEATFYSKADETGLDVLAPNGSPIGKSVKLGPVPVLSATKQPTLVELNIQNTISAPLGPFTLLGYQLGRDKASAGETIPLSLYWRADSQPNRDYTFRVHFGDTTSDALPLANSQYPTSKWRPNEIIRGQYNIAIPANAKDGAANLRVVLVGADGNPPAIDLAKFTVEKTDRVFVKPATQFAQNANFNNFLSLVGYNVPTLNLKPSESLKLTLFWQARNKMDKPYTVFVHLLDSAGKVAAQKDAQPARATTTWVANEFITDTYELPLTNVAPGKYQIEIGWYDAKDPAFARLQILDDKGAAAGDHIILNTTITVQP